MPGPILLVISKRSRLPMTQTEKHAESTTLNSPIFTLPLLTQMYSIFDFSLCGSQSALQSAPCKMILSWTASQTAW